MGLVVISTFFVIWLPILRHDPLAVIKRIFPFERGLYEVKNIYIYESRSKSIRNGFIKKQ